MHLLAWGDYNMKKRIIGSIWLTLAITASSIIISWKSDLTLTSNKHLPKITKVISKASSPSFEQYTSSLYEEIRLNNTGLSLNVFEKALTGFYNLKNNGCLNKNKSILTIADFDKSSSKKRLWIINLAQKTLLLNTWVAHGKNSGFDLPTHFSNSHESNESSVGFYVTGEIYHGKHGKSLKIDGMDEGFNTNARSRSIVVHGADYVSQETINQLGRLGRSQGCPAVPSFLASTIIDIIQGKTVLYINSSNLKNYNSKYLASVSYSNSIDSLL